jgi:hypothetical protein
MVNSGEISCFYTKTASKGDKFLSRNLTGLGFRECDKLASHSTSLGFGEERGEFA